MLLVVRGLKGASVVFYSLKFKSPHELLFHLEFGWFQLIELYLLIKP